MFRRRFWLLMLCAPMVGAAVQRAEAQSWDDVMQRYFDDLTSDGGYWTAENEAFREGSGQPTHYGYHYRWGIDRRYVRNTIFSINEDGSCIGVWDETSTWDPALKKVVTFQTGRPGALIRGEKDLLEDGTHRTILRLTLPDGSTQEFHDAVRWIDRNSFESRTLQERDGEWFAIQVLNWTRHDGDPCVG